MNSSMIGKIEKARRYAEEPDRVKFQSLDVHFKGTHDEYTVTMSGADFTCNCHFFATVGEGTCCHVMALQRMLAPMLSEDQQTAGAPFSFAAV